MEDIAPSNNSIQAQGLNQLATAQQTFNSLTRAMGKVKVKLTSDQLRSVANIVAYNLATAGHRKGLFELADLLELYKLNEKLKKQMLNTKAQVKLSLNMCEASSLYLCLDRTEFSEYAIYETNLAFYIITEIDSQTV